MSTTEDRLRAAARAAAATVPPDSAPPLQLPAGRAARPSLLARIRAMTPLAAAISVIAAIAAALVITSGLPGRHTGPADGAPAGQPTASPATASTATPSPATPTPVPSSRARKVGTAVGLSGVPAYYVALAGPPGTPQPAQIRDTATGAVLATVLPPRPYYGFTWVSGAADDHSFVLAAQRWWPIAPGDRGQAAEKLDNTTDTGFFRLTFGPAGRTPRLTALPTGSPVMASSLSGLALSPDGSRLAVGIRPTEIRVITLATGTAATWIWPAAAGRAGMTWLGNFKPAGAPLSWTADGRILAFQAWADPGGATAQLRLLDTTSPGGSLASARLAVTFTGTQSAAGGNTIITGDGARIIAVTGSPDSSRFRVTEFSARTGQPVSTPGTEAFAGSLEPWDVLWASRDGSTLVLAAGPGADPARSRLAVLWHGRLTLLPGAVDSVDMAW